MWEIEYYETKDGYCPTREYFDELIASNKNQELNKIHYKLDLLEEHGYNLHRPHADLLRDHIYELRVPVKRQQYRLLYFYFYQEKIIISHVIIKESNVPHSEIEKAIRNRQDYILRNERKK